MPNLARFQSAVRSQLLILAVSVFTLVTSPVVGQSVTATQNRQQEARNVLDEGVQAFKNGQYDEATLDFQRAKQLDAKLRNASLTSQLPTHHNISLERAARKTSSADKTLSKSLRVS
jgi:hypothetical protein